MYKALAKGTSVKKNDPWAYCRNAKCSLCGVNQAEQEQPPVQPDPESVEEPVVVRKARERIQKALKADQGQDNLIGLTLAILAQEMGHSEIADQMIDEYSLTERFGIQKKS